ncbi:hypothetical protein H112_01602 [Trichophyton rubrum D6]|uniref:Uncharacterized protein n=2 Tax=Trichophyton TaxID=5550 RepID=A0A022WC94_TRIRU|nr:hypothetical protein H100_01599 [Trichophyton rubrum MR850]EZF45278.1 hypothetical protein H102_01593 [Trichophyton rubrum CBS 100081]EZF55982.1 hypothetical protein H103_01606 [Trichophyton rubrum CBS 288.86]EZF66681.1 hypothetical protein H104_01581 [Trichophyton rubrum CBS 289.86]EZF77291.1 hypothetical protein H105_01609 [Trichophyton soudanense CBS 452.61]EZF87829.1 hypothetical protein H110_01602 [Trichophyton rubrum MR1448]EZF98761.1 hypothetical protein H113_01604 [Trichophyton rub
MLPCSKLRNELNLIGFLTIAHLFRSSTHVRHHCLLYAFHGRTQKDEWHWALTAKPVMTDMPHCGRPRKPRPLICGSYTTNVIFHSLVFCWLTELITGARYYVAK